MSSGSIEIVAALDPQLEVSNSLTWGVLRGPSNAIWKEYKSTTLSNSSMDFNCPPPNSNVYLSPYVLVETDVNIQFSCSNDDYVAAGRPANLISLGVSDALRAFPISSITQSANISMNSTTISSSLNTYVAEFMRYRPDSDDTRISVQPTMLDATQEYITALGTAFNPLSGFKSSTPERQGRGTFSYKTGGRRDVSASIGGRRYQNFVFTLTENVLMSPFLYNSKPMTQAFFGLQNLGFSFQFEKLPRIWSHMLSGRPSQEIQDLTVNANFIAIPAITTGAGYPGMDAQQNARILVSWLSPNITQVVPRTNMYGYYQHTPYITTCKYGSNNPNDIQATFTTQAISLRVVPNRVFIFIKKRKGTLTERDTDSYEHISKCSVNFDTLEGIFSSASATQIFQMSADNGLRDSFRETKDRVGSVLCYSFGSQIALPAGLAPGVSGTFSLSFNITMDKIAHVVGKNDGVDMDCVVLTESSGIVQLFDDNSIVNTGVVSSKQVLEARNENVSFDQLSAASSDAVAGGFGVGSLIKKTIPVVRAVVDAVDSAAPLFGEGKMRGSAKLGGDLIKSGGAMLTKAQLKRLAQQ